MAGNVEQLALFLDGKDTADIVRNKTEREKLVRVFNDAKLPLESFKTLCYMYDIAPMDDVGNLAKVFAELIPNLGALTGNAGTILGSTIAANIRVYINTGLKLGDMCFYLVSENLSGLALYQYRLELGEEHAELPVKVPKFFNIVKKKAISTPDPKLLKMVNDSLERKGELNVCPFRAPQVFDEVRAEQIEALYSGETAKLDKTRELALSKLARQLAGRITGITYEDSRSLIYSNLHGVGYASRGAAVNIKDYKDAQTFKDLASYIGFTTTQLARFEDVKDFVNDNKYRGIVSGLEYTDMSYNAWHRAKNARYVGRVEEANNYRLAVLLYDSTNYPDSGLIILVHSDQLAYSQLDCGNVLFSYGSVFDTTCNASKDEIKQYLNMDIRVSGRITRDYIDHTIGPAVRRAKLVETEKKEQQEMAVIKAKRLSNKLKELASGEREFTLINEVKYTRTCIEHAGVKLELPQDVMAHVYANTSVAALEDVEFNTILRHFFDLGLGYGETGPLSGGNLIRKGSIVVRVNSITATVSFQENARGYARLEINGNRINKAEVIPVLLRMICFDNTGQEAFDTFVSSVSHTSLQLVRFLSNGLEFTYTNPFIRTNNTGLLNIVRRKSTNYIVLKKPVESTGKSDGKEAEVKFNLEEVKVNDTAKLLSLAGDRRHRYQSKSLNEVVETLKEATELSDDNCRFIIRTAGNTYLEAVKKSEALLKKTMERLGVTLGKHPSLSGEFYKVKGKSGNNYYISNDENLYIYQENGAFICIVDRGAAMQNTVGRDRLVARIYAVYADSQTAAEIHTLRGLV